MFSLTSLIIPPRRAFYGPSANPQVVGARTMSFSLVKRTRNNSKIFPRMVIARRDVVTSFTPQRQHRVDPRGSSRRHIASKQRARRQNQRDRHKRDWISCRCAVQEYFHYSSYGERPGKPG